MDFYNRSGWISIEGRDGKMHDFKGLDFKFSGEKVGSAYGKFECSIGGLSSDSINELSAWNVGESVKRMRRVDVYAGYEDSGAERIFSGYVLEAHPTPPPDMWVNIVCLPKLDQSVNVSVQTHGSLDDVTREVANHMGLEYYRIDINYDESKKFKFVYDGSRIGLVNSLAKSVSAKVFVEDDTLIVASKRGWLEAVKNAHAISMQTGMISTPKVDMRGAVIRVRVDDSYGICSWVYLDSKLFPKANGYYFVIKKKHQGHFRGDEWFTDLECIRAGAQV